MEKYVEERDKKYLQKLRDDVLPYLPNFCYDYFISISTTTTILTRYNYGTDLRVFFDYLISPNACLHGKDVKKITIDDMKTITNRDIERFIDYISGYYSPINGNYVKNSDRAKTRKLSAIRTLFKYLYNNNYLPENVASKVKTPKLREKEIIRLEDNEINEVFTYLSGDEDAFDSKMQNSYNKNNTLIRDEAIISLLLGTGIRVSECVGLNTQDLYLNTNPPSFKVIRKGEKEAILYLNDNLVEILNNYLLFRQAQLENKGIDPNSIDALFISLQNKRINVRTVEILVKKYAKAVNPLKKITPHKLRSTYGTELYRNTGDIYAVAEILGHKDINTTKKHYAAISEDIKKEASSKVDFRKKD